MATDYCNAYRLRPSLNQRSGNRNAGGGFEGDSGWSGYEVERHLRTQFQVEDEMADWFNVVYVLSPHDDQAATERLLAQPRHARRQPFGHAATVERQVG